MAAGYRARWSCWAVKPKLSGRSHTDGLISVVIPCYNQAQFLGAAIESALGQTYGPKEVVVVDDGSTDDSAEVAARYPVTCVRQRNRGLAEARNRGLRESTGAFVVFLDADDLLLPGALAAGVQSLAAHPQCAFVFGGYKHIAYDGSALPLKPPPDDPGSYLDLLHYNHVGCPAAAMYRRDIFDLVGAFDSRFNPAEDYELYLRIARRYPIRRHAQTVAAYRKYATSMSGNHGRMLRTIIRLLRAQRPHLRSPEERRACSDGIKGNRAYYCDQMRAQVRAGRGDVMSAGGKLRAYVALLRWNPRSIVKAIAPDLYCRVFRTRDAIRNQSIRWLARSRGSGGSICASPNPIRIGTERWNGPESTTIEWRTHGASVVNVRVNSPDGPLFSSFTPDGRVETGEWVVDGTRFYLQDVSAADIPNGRTLAVLTVTVVPE